MSDATLNLRPQQLDDYIGQKNVVDTLRVFLTASKSRGVPQEHLLFYGPPGIGKTTLASIIATELHGEIKITSGAAVQKSGDLAAILTNLKDNDVLFIDEIHRLPKTVEEMLYPVMEDSFLDIVIGKGPSARTVRLPVAPITIVGATTRLAMLSAPLRDRFGLILRLDYYDDREMENIIMRSSKILGIPMDKESAHEIAIRSRHTPRLANRILKRAHDVLLVDHHKSINRELLERLFVLLELDSYGLNQLDRQYLTLIGVTFQNNPMGIETIASSLSEDRQTIEEFVEPYLLQIGFVKKTSRGRVLSDRALKHIGATKAKLHGEQPSLV
jgi:holliday junction DNA helicase RuvB